MSILTRRPIKPADRKISASQVNEIQQFTRQKRLGEQIITDENQFESIGDHTGGQLVLSSVPILYTLVASGEAESSSSTTPPPGSESYLRAKRVGSDGNEYGAILKFRIFGT